MSAIYYFNFSEEQMYNVYNIDPNQTVVYDNAPLTWLAITTLLVKTHW